MAWRRSTARRFPISCHSVLGVTVRSPPLRSSVTPRLCFLKLTLSSPDVYGPDVTIPEVTFCEAELAPLRKPLRTPIGKTLASSREQRREGRSA